MARFLPLARWALGTQSVDRTPGKREWTGVRTDSQDRGSKQVQQFLEAVAIRLKSLGCAVVIQPHVVSGRYATSLIIGETRDAAAHLHAAESIGAEVVESLGDAALLQQFAQRLFNSTALLSEVTIPKDPAVQ